MDIFCLAVGGGGCWWMVADIFWVVVGGGGWWWVVVDIFWMVVGGGGSWQFSLTNREKKIVCKRFFIKYFRF